jgi:hypothetical protein
LQQQHPRTRTPSPEHSKKICHPSIPTTHNTPRSSPTTADELATEALSHASRSISVLSLTSALSRVLRFREESSAFLPAASREFPTLFIRHGDFSRDHLTSLVRTSFHLQSSLNILN